VKDFNYVLYINTTNKLHSANCLLYFAHIGKNRHSR